MACQAKLLSGWMVCRACNTSWSVFAKDQPGCKREAGKGRDPKLTRAEIDALKDAETQWLNRTANGFRGKVGKRHSREVVGSLTALHLVFKGRAGGIRATTYGSAWLDRNTKGRNRLDGD